MKGYCAKDNSVTVWKDEKVLKMDGSDASTTMGMDLMPMNYILRNG